MKEGQVIALDYGSTSQIMALALKERFRKLTVITNSVQNLLVLSDCPGFTVILTEVFSTKKNLPWWMIPRLSWTGCTLIFFSCPYPGWTR